jgi:hypothetical protein
MTRCFGNGVLQDGKGKEAIKPRAQAGPGAGRRRAGLRGALRGEEDKEVRQCREEGRQEGRQQPQARRAPPRTLGTRFRVVGCSRIATFPRGAIPRPKKGLSAAAGALLALRRSARERGELDRLHGLRFSGLPVNQ